MKKFIALIGFILFLNPLMEAQNVLTPPEVLGLKYVYNNQLSPDGSQMIYTIITPRGPNEEAGGGHRETLIMNLNDKESKPVFAEDFKGYSPQFTPDGNALAYLLKGEDGVSQLWTMSIDGSNKKQITNEVLGVSNFKWNPNGKGIAFLRMDQATDREKDLKKRGYGFIFFEENIKRNNLFYVALNEDGVQVTIKQLTNGVQVWDYHFNTQGSMIAAGISPQNLVDHKYIFQRVHVINLESGERKQVSKNEGKLGNFVFSPDGKKLAYAAALNINDNQVSQAFVADLESGEVANYTPEKFKGHIGFVNWKSSKELLYHAQEGVYNNLYSVSIAKKERKLLLDGKKSEIVFQGPQFNSKFNSFIFSGSTTSDRINLYSWNGKGSLERITNVNPVLETKALGEQKVIKYPARDGLEIEGIITLPINYDANTKYPLIIYVHGGPESHHSNGWLTGYSTPVQVMAGKGYMVAQFNYRASTGYGVDFAMQGLGDPAGKEFDDIADGLQFLIANYGVDKKRVGLAGGSYGGYASAWFATYYTEHVRAVAMFVGISNLISKRGTTDIPYEEMYVHSGKQLEEQWQLNLERSPVYWAHQSKTATLIYGGAADPRVHPTQSMELFRRMKVNKHPAVRLVQYPGEGHGNRKQVGQIDVLYRQMAWFDWYVKDLKPLDGEMPPLDVSNSYGLDW